MVAIDTNKRTLGLFRPNTLLNIIAVFGILVLMFIIANNPFEKGVAVGKEIALRSATAVDHTGGVPALNNSLLMDTIIEKLNSIAASAEILSQQYSLGTDKINEKLDTVSTSSEREGQQSVAVDIQVKLDSISYQQVYRQNH